MADPNNIPQAAKQLSEDLNSSDKEVHDKAQSEVANTQFDKEYKIAQQNSTGSGTQSSDSNPVSRQLDKLYTEGEVIDSPGDSDPSDYLEMAKDITKNVEAAAE